MSALEAALRWYAALLLITWAFAPAVRWLCASLSDRGAAVTRPLALLAAVYPAWLLAGLGVVPFGAAPVIATVVIAGAVGWVAFARDPSRDLAWLRTLAITEIASAALFAGYVWLRGFTPQILNTEKPMDVALLASSARSLSIPPADPWFAGQPINYYYLGYLLHGTLARLTGVAPSIALNLALATIFSTTMVACFGVAWNVVRPWWGRNAALAAGGLGAFAVVLAGNLFAPIRLLQDPLTVWNAWWWDTDTGIGWRASRIVCDGLTEGYHCPPPAVATINEFPAFSLILGDLHPHLMALPYVVTIIALAWNVYSAPAGTLTTRAWAVRLALSGAAAGALYALNAWDLPTGLALLLIAAVVAAGPLLADRLRAGAILLLAAALPWLPFVAVYRPPVVSLAGIEPTWLTGLPIVARVFSLIAPYEGVRTSAAEYLTMFGLSWAVGVALVLAGPGWNDTRASIGRPAVIAMAALALLAVAFSAPVLLLCGVPLTLALAQLARKHGPDPRTFALAAYSAAWFLCIIVEFVYIRDLFDNRMNTLFKFYYQAWTLSALGMAVALVALAVAARRSFTATLFVRLATVAALVLGLTYPVVASKQWTDDFAEWQGMDGIAYADPDEVAAIRWLAANALPGDVVLEAAGCSYYPLSQFPYSRVSAFTGIPTVIGWGNHERQWRSGQPDLTAQIDARAEDVRAMYADPASPLFAQYGVDWIFIGQYETGAARPECAVAGPYDIDLAAMEAAGWQTAFESGDVRLLHRASG
ncbi:MAG: DUF2298 domain-containing protein [Thermomicrobiales bacterium]